MGCLGNKGCGETAAAAPASEQQRANDINHIDDIGGLGKQAEGAERASEARLRVRDLQGGQAPATPRKREVESGRVSELLPYGGRKATACVPGQAWWFVLSFSRG